MRLTVFRYRVLDSLANEAGSQTQISSHYAVREYIEQLTGASVIEEDFLEVDESDLDMHGRIEAY